MLVIVIVIVIVTVNGIGIVIGSRQVVALVVVVRTIVAQFSSHPG